MRLQRDRWGGHLPHQLLVVEGQRGLPAEDVHLALEDGHLHLPFHVLLRLGDAVADIFTLGAVPESCGEGKVRPREVAVPLASGQSTGSGAGAQEGAPVCHSRHGPGLPRSLPSSGTLCTGEGPRQGARPRAPSCDPADSCG